ncbi:MAG: hypothetical protein MZW92_49645 [Comamonadaceae bacterium]|nr:hypothetical protein [Comamonadaceae bacterium]
MLANPEPETAGPRKRLSADERRRDVVAAVVELAAGTRSRGHHHPGHRRSHRPHPGRAVSPLSRQGGDVGRGVRLGAGRTRRRGGCRLRRRRRTAGDPGTGISRPRGLRCTASRGAAHPLSRTAAAGRIGLPRARAQDGGRLSAARVRAAE